MIDSSAAVGAASQTSYTLMPTVTGTIWWFGGHRMAAAEKDNRTTSSVSAAHLPVEII
ncbi:MAG: hypothetical protein ACREAA_00075 [Candidatus Polarisedimenticolia bacterium]